MTTSTSTSTQINGIKIIVLDKNEPFIQAKEFIGKADITVSWDNTQNCYTVQAIPSGVDTNEPKYSLVSTKRDEEVFCHKAGFVGKYKLVNYLQGSIDPYYVDGIVIEIKDRGIIEIPIGEEYLA
jgi:hypothetical protein